MISLICAVSWETDGLWVHWSDPFLVLQCAEPGSVLGSIQRTIQWLDVWPWGICVPSRGLRRTHRCHEPWTGPAAVQVRRSWSPPPEPASLACCYTASLGSMLMCFFTSWNLNLEFGSCHFLNAFYIMEKLLKFTSVPPLCAHGYCCRHFHYSRHSLRLLWFCQDFMSLMV